VKPVGTADLLGSLRDLYARARGRPGLLDEAIATMTELGFQVARLSGREDVLRAALEIIPPGARAVSHPCVVGRAVRIEHALRAEGRGVVALPGDNEPSGQNGSWREQLLAAQVGITGATAIVADTGSLVLAEANGFGRAASNVPPVHVALVTADSVVENLLDAAVLIRGYAALHLDTPVPRYVSLISGPSRTADIGYTLVRGMHGPRAVHVLVWDQPKATGAGDAALRDWVLA